MSFTMTLHPIHPVQLLDVDQVDFSPPDTLSNGSFYATEYGPVRYFVACAPDARLGLKPDQLWFTRVGLAVALLEITKAGKIMSVIDHDAQFSTAEGEAVSYFNLRARRPELAL